MSLSLTACMNLATTSAQAIYNRHSLQSNLTDDVITLRIYRGFDRQNPAFKHVNIAIATLRGEVLMVGQVPHAWQKKLAEKIVRSVPNVERVHNFITIANPSSSLTRVSDAWITSKVKSRLMMSNDLDATQLKVVTEDGIVYLMGMLFPDEAKVAIKIASHTYGVQAVITIISILHVEKK